MATKTKGTQRGRLLGFRRGAGEWLAIVQWMSNERPDGVVLVETLRMTELKGPQRRKASRWLVELGEPAIA